MRTVRSVINEALFIVGFNQDGQDVPDGFQFQRNFDRFQNVASVLRAEYPFNVQRILQFSELSDIPFVSIDSMVGSTSFASASGGVRYPMRSIPKHTYDTLTVHPVIGGIPQYYYFEPPSQVLTYPTILDDYEFAITGKINESLSLQPDDEFVSTNIIYINYLIWMLAEYFSCVYQKQWTSSQQIQLNRAEYAVKDNTKKDYQIYSPEENGFLRIYRARNFIRGS